MLHTKFHGNRPAGSGEDVCRVFTIYRHGGHLGHVTITILTTFHFTIPESLHKNLVQNGLVVSEKSKI